MTKDEAVKRLSVYIVCLKCEISGKECDDNCRYQYEAGTMGEIVEALETLIRAEPQERTGKWIKMSDADGEYYCCDQCGEELNRYTTETPSFDNPYPRKYSIERTKFCPNCGARMDSEQILSEADNDTAYGGLMSAT